MFLLPSEFSELISAFSQLFSNKVFARAGQLLLGTILTHGKRTVCSVLRSIGLSRIRYWDKYHRVLSRASWSPLQCSRVLLGLLLKRFFDSDTLIFGIDETIERRRGSKIKAKGIYHDPIRSSKSYHVKCSGLRWISVMLLTPLSWTHRIWALPFLTVLAPSERYHQQQGKRHKTINDWARQIGLLLHRWLPDFQLVMLGDGTYAGMELLAAAPRNVAWIVRFRLDARLHDFPPPYQKGQMGRPPQKGKRQISLEQRINDPQTPWKKATLSKWYDQENKQVLIASGISLWYRAGKPLVPIKWILIRDPDGGFETRTIACTNLGYTPLQILSYYLQRWQVEVTFEEVRAHLGVETQRQWADLSIARTTPVLMALFAIITLWADQLAKQGKLTIFHTAWYQKAAPTFSDALASVRYRIWRLQLSLHSAKSQNSNKSLEELYQHLAFMAARAA